MSDIAIQIDHVWKKFRKGEVHDSLRELIPALFRRMVGKTQQQQNLKQSEFWALKDVSFEVKKGESLGIIGPNGAGKSTMLKVLSRILKPNRGSYHIDGRLTALIEVGAGFHPDLTGRENIYLNGTILGMTRQEIKQREEAIIDFAAIDGFIDTPVKRYSSGMGARLGFAIAAHLRTDVLLVDEVLSVGDARFRHKCIAHMNRLLRSGITVVFISHILDQVRSLCPNTVVLDKGEVVYNGATDGAIRTYLERLGANEQEAETTSASVAEIRDIRLCDAQGNETLEWRVGEAGYVAFELVMHKPCLAVQIGVDISTISGTYIGSVNSNQQMTHLVPSKATGTFTVRMGISPMPLADGDYNLSFNVFIYDMEDKHQHVWQSRQPRIVPIRGNEPGGMLVQMKSRWDVQPAEAEGQSNKGDGAPIPYPKPLPPTGSL